MNVEKELAGLKRMTVDQLRSKWVEVFREECRSRHKEYLVKRIIWRMQANAEGDLSERAMKRAMELANDADLRVTAPREKKSKPDVQSRTKSVTTASRSRSGLLPGTVLKRDYKGETHRVTVLDDGFEYLGERYKSLSAVAKAITGQHWSGNLFFGIRKEKS